MTEDQDTPTDTDRVQALQADYMDLLHAIQTGCEYGGGGMQGLPPLGPQVALDRWAVQKHLRVGINSAINSAGGLCKLLIAKGVITELEYWTAVVDEFRAAIAHEEAALTQRLGAEVHLR